MLSLAGKVASNEAVAAQSQDVLEQRLSALLTRNQFEVRTERRALGMVVLAKRGDCTMAVRESPATGGYESVFGLVAQPYGGLSYVYRGAVAGSSPPKLRALTDYWVGMELARVHLASTRHPLLAVAASPSCDVAALDWGDTAAVPR